LCLCVALPALAACAAAAPGSRALPATAPAPAPAPDAATLATSPVAHTAVSLDKLADGIKHYRNRNGADYTRYAPEQIALIAENVLLYQRANGGWIENQDPTRVLPQEERARFLADKAKPEISFDNRNVYSQVEYLAAVFQQTGDPRHRDASLRGLEVILAHQYQSCGGWPHTVPGREPYHPHITIADDVTSGVLTTMRQVAAGIQPFGFADPALRARARQAVDRGDACLLRLQVVQRGELTGWAGQYDRQTLQPALGRSYELPAIASQESTEVVRYLMGIEVPSAAVIRAIEAAVGWLERSKLTGIRVETFPAEPVKYKNHSSTTDRRLVQDPAAPPLWARFYDLADNSVVLANRDGNRVESYAEIARERRTGYSWYGSWPAGLLADSYPAWKARRAQADPRESGHQSPRRGRFHGRQGTMMLSMH
jgi:PelA/Pel-15E family pectate lyase